MSIKTNYNLNDFELLEGLIQNHDVKINNEFATPFMILAHLDYIEESFQKSFENSFETRIVIGESKPHYMPHYLYVMKSEGDGLCWLNSLVMSIFAAYSNNIQELYNWINSIIDTLESNVFFRPMFGLNKNMIYIVESNNDYCEIEKFLNENMNLIKILVFNILKFCVQNFTPKYLNLVFNIQTTKKSTYGVECISTNNFVSSVAFNRKDRRFIAIDGKMRNFTMSVMGISKVVVLQHNTNKNNQRSSNSAYRMKTIKYNNEYAGFEIEVDNIINVKGAIGSVLLYTYDANHYDCVFNNETNCSAVAFNAESLPNFV